MELLNLLSYDSVHLYVRTYVSHTACSIVSIIADDTFVQYIRAYVEFCPIISSICTYGRT